jgi:hypothetical protein
LNRFAVTIPPNTPKFGGNVCSIIQGITLIQSGWLLSYAQRAQLLPLRPRMTMLMKMAPGHKGKSRLASSSSSATRKMLMRKD